MGEGPQTLISSYQKSTWAFREIQVDIAEIRIFYGGAEPEIIQHPCNEWTTLYIGYHAQLHTTTWHYIINNNPKLIGSFSSESILEMRGGIAVGSRYNNQHFLNGEIANIEMYHKPGENLFPESLKQIVIEQQLVKFMNETSSRKRKYDTE